MANLSKKNGVYLARFRYQGKEYKKSLKTTDRTSALAAMHRVEDAFHRLAICLITVPQDVDAGDFIVSGGTLTSPTTKPDPQNVPTLDVATAEYLRNLGHMAESNRYTTGVHLRNLKKKLVEKVGLPINLIERRDLEAFLQARLKERAHTTVSKERDTVVRFFDWTVGQGYLRTSPAAGLTKVKSGGDLPPFRTVDEITAILARGGLTRDEEWALWDCLFLAPAEIGEILTLVKERAKRDVSFILHAIPSAA